MNNNTQRIIAAIAATRQVSPGHFEKLLGELTTRSPHLCFPGLSAAEVEAAIGTSDWNDYMEPNLNQECTAFSAAIPGAQIEIGYVELKWLPADLPCHLCEQKVQTGCYIPKINYPGPYEVRIAVFLVVQSGEEIVLDIRRAFVITDFSLLIKPADDLPAEIVDLAAHRQIPLTVGEVMNLGFRFGYIQKEEKQMSRQLEEICR